MKHIFLSWLMLYTVILPALSLTKCYDAAQLSSARVTSLCQDYQGYVWIGTEYGLNKFDGVHFTQYYNDDTNPRSLADDIVRQLMVDSRGHAVDRQQHRRPALRPPHRCFRDGDLRGKARYQRQRCARSPRREHLGADLGEN